ncbi:uncharacterized protein LOC110106979 [Dendrobium catenatum]|uniref:Bifunctional inhibitor/plant lipid transfer protein/seed storage helical domain-containing protein n=1 Tax=Dendrobium catenatum TaxID=906689 RepID=A0A2I0WMK8_9ASPA|nr:uncharacterized protein LOC110106979 [Dendrobium catenatum]PKU76886.1 hypothetical protein MA16_Dca001492 [Dendrobium catenatum]
MAMAFKLKTAIILIFSLAMKQTEHSAEASTSVLPCLERFLPCQYYMHDLNPPDFCCMHLKGMMAYDPNCICSVFRNDNILRALNTTTLEAANLTANCGLIKPDFKICDDKSTSSITLGENLRNANVFIWVSISLLIMVGLM